MAVDLRKVDDELQVPFDVRVMDPAVLIRALWVVPSPMEIDRSAITNARDRGPSSACLAMVP